MKLRTSVVCIFAFLCSSCWTHNSLTVQDTLKAESIYNSIQCNRFELQSQIILLSDAEHYEQEYKKIRGYIVGSEKETPPAVDFSRENVLLLDMGQQPTAGYSLEFNSGAASNDEMDIKIYWREPEPAIVYAQVITSHCMLIKIPARRYSRVRVVDQHNNTRFEIKNEK